MNCPKCNSLLSEKKSRCERCGEDVRAYKKAAKASNLFYNQGLAKANVRDLSGAIVVLKKSLQLNKRNTNARNLLGLIYFEIGETVSALNEWVISRHFQHDENEAEDYIESIQSNPTKLDTLNQAIKKYNLALASAKQDSEDLAIIQLKKVVSINPRFIRAHQLLALLYIKSNERDKARKSLMKAQKIDVNNTTTLRYLRELGESFTTPESSERNTSTRKVVADPNPSIAPVSSYKEEKPNVIAFINLVIGVVIGIAVVYVLMVPNIEKGLVEEYNQKMVDYNSSQAAQNATISTLENDKKDLESQITKLEKEIKDFEIVEYDEAMYDTLFEGITAYLDNDKTLAAETLIKVDLNKVKRPKALELYNRIKDTTFKSVSSGLYTEGHKQYTARKYQESIETFTKAISMDEENVNALYFMGRAYHQLGEKDNAREYYTNVIENFPNTNRAKEAKVKINQL